MKLRAFLTGAILVVIFASLEGRAVFAAPTSPVNATVDISVCGDSIAQTSEDCDLSDLKNETCATLGFASGNLDCDASCSFLTTGCVTPTINPDSVAPEEVSSLLAAGYFSEPPTASLVSTPSLTTTDVVTISLSDGTGTSSASLPSGVVITKTDDTNFDPRDLTAAAVSESSLSGFSSATAVGAFQWGLADATLEFSVPITLTVYVGSSLNGQTLNVVRSGSLNSGWTSEGIVTPATCVVASGQCSFQATKASYFAATQATATSSSSSTSTSTTTSSTTSQTTTTTTTSVSLTKKVPWPSKLLLFYTNIEGRIPLTRLFTTVKIWVEAWRNTSSEKCDINNDRECNLKDLSVLLYFVDR